MIGYPIIEKGLGSGPSRCRKYLYFCYGYQPTIPVEEVARAL